MIGIILLVSLLSNSSHVIEYTRDFSWRSAEGIFSDKHFSFKMLNVKNKTRVISFHKNS